MKKLIAMVAVVAAAAWSACGVERVAVDEVVTHFPWDAKVDCVYTMSGLESGSAYKGAFTLSVKKDGKIVRRAVTNVLAAADGTYTNTFDCVALFGAELYLNGGVTVDLIKVNDRTGTPIGITGDVLVIDVSAGSSAATYPTKELTGVDIGTFNCDVYKTDKIVLRKIEPGTFTMGSPSDELGRNSDETQHQVTLTKGYYIGVFEVTQRQWELVMGTRPSYFNNTTCYASRPVEQVSYNMIRGASSGAQWPASNAVDADSFLGKIRAKTGLVFDLPTEAQWECACRAGTTTALNSGKNLTRTGQDAEMDKVGRYWYNGGSSYSQSCDPSAGTAKVGSYVPNAWGLYDMHGNVWEWCLDWWQDDLGTSAVTDPVGATSGDSRDLRGGSWYSDASDCRSAYRSGCNPSYGYGDGGFRLACSAGSSK